MKYDDLVKELLQEAFLSEGEYRFHRAVLLHREAAEAIKELQSTVVIVEVKENKDGVSNT